MPALRALTVGPATPDIGGIPMERPPTMRPVYAAMLLALAALGGCASSFPRLVSEAQVTDLAEFRARTAAHANHTLLVPTGGVGATPLRIGVHEIGSGSHEWTVVLLHGMFSDSSTWRFIQGSLAEDHDLWAIDLPGCGSSDAPDPRDGPQAYSPESVARCVLEAVRDRMKHRDSPPRIVIVGHSYGGLLALRMFGDSAIAAEYSDVLGRVERLVLLSPVDAAMHRLDPLFLKVARASGLQIELGLALGVVREEVARGTLRSVPNDRPALREEAEKRLEILRDPRRRRAMQALMGLTIPLAETDPPRPDWARIERIEAGYARVNPPTLILWGRHDETLPISMGYKLAAQLPAAVIVPLDNCMHSPHLERPGLTAAAIREFARTGQAPAINP
jgi:pimeloyl-ACP methyl ester carboxylesterase